jgi:hypothetical protein
VRTLAYQVLISQGSGYVLASVPDLRCEAVGATPALALAAVRKLAARRLYEYDGKPDVPPAPSMHSLARIELPLPTSSSPACRLQRC